MQMVGVHWFDVVFLAYIALAITVLVVIARAVIRKRTRRGP